MNRSSYCENAHIHKIAIICVSLRYILVTTPNINNLKLNKIMEENIVILPVEHNPPTKTLSDYANHLSVISNSKYYNDWFYTNYNYIMYTYNEEHGHYVNFCSPLYESCKLNEYNLHYWDDSVNVSDYLVMFLRKLIADKYYIIIELNEKHVPNTSNYGVNDYQHRHMVYGYDDSGFYMLGHDKNRQYARNLISNEDIIKSYTLIPVIEGEKADFSHELPMMFLRLTDNPYYLDWGQLAYEFANYSDPDFKVVSGGQTYLYNINVTRRMISIVREMIKGGYRKDPRLISVISEHKGVIYRKIEYLVEKGVLSPDDNIINEFKKIKDESQLCLSLFLKYQMTNTEKTAISIMDKLSYIIEGELKGFKYVSVALNEYLEKIKWDKALIFNNLM